jgi:predicted glycosyltransferase
MRVWIDLANSPHVAVFGPVAERFRREGWEVILTARDHAQTVALAQRVWPEVRVIGGESPAGRATKAYSLARRANDLRRFAVNERPDAALSHASYAQIVAARLARVPVVTMMDYEFQPANHLSFRLAQRVIVPEAFPDWALRRYGARSERVIRYSGFKEEIYIAQGTTAGSLVGLELDPEKVIVVMRPPPEGALYHQFANRGFDELLDRARARHDTQVILLPRTRSQTERYQRLEGVLTPSTAVDGCSLLAAADVVIGAGGTMNRESALLGTPTYTVFAGRLAAVDAELMRMGLLHDLREPGAEPVFTKKQVVTAASTEARGEAILEVITSAVHEVAA